jgi:hypothetical protein
VNVTVFGFNVIGGLYDIPLLELSYAHESAVDVQRLSLQGLPEGIYRLRVNGADEMLYLRPRQDWYDTVGMLHIVHGDSAPLTHRLLNNDGSFAHPLFTIRIAPLTVLWEYTAKTDRVKNVLDSAGQISFASAGSRKFRSTLPHRLREAPYDSITVEYNDTNPLDPTKTIQIEHIDVPGYRHRGIAMQNSTAYITSQVILNY